MRKLALILFMIILATVYESVSGETCFDDAVDGNVECDNSCCGSLSENDRRCCEKNDTNNSSDTAITGYSSGTYTYVALGALVVFVLCWVCAYIFVYVLCKRTLQSCCEAPTN